MDRGQILAKIWPDLTDLWPPTVVVLAATNRLDCDQNSAAVWVVSTSDRIAVGIRPICDRQCRDRWRPQIAKILNENWPKFNRNLVRVGVQPDRILVLARSRSKFDRFPVIPSNGAALRATMLGTGGGVVRIYIYSSGSLGNTNERFMSTDYCSSDIFVGIHRNSMSLAVEL